MAANHSHQPSQSMSEMNAADMASLDTFKLVAETQKQVAQVTGHALEMVKQYYKKPEELAACIEKQGTPVYVVRKGFIIHWLLFFLGFEPGFIPATVQKRYQFLLRFLEKKSGCTFENGLFIMTKPLFTVGFIAHQLHHWIAFCSGLPGYAEKDQALYRNFWEKKHGVITTADAEQMSADEIIRLKNAINRDLEAMKFMKQLINELFAPANQAGSLSKGTATA